MCAVKLLWNLEFDFEFLLFFFKNLLEDCNVRTVDFHRNYQRQLDFVGQSDLATKYQGAVRSHCKEPRDGRISLQIARDS